MSTSDKTREALLNTMVKSKTGAQAADTEEKKEEAPAAAPKAESRPAAKKKAAKKKAAAKKAPAKKTAAKKPAAKSEPAADPFQSKGRVWPD